MSFSYQVLFEDNHLLIVNKPAGFLIQGDRTGDVPLVEHYKTYVKEKYKKPGAVFLGVVHRLDRPVSGAVVFARTSKALERMNKLLREKEFHKSYWAIVKEKPPNIEDNLIHYLVKDGRVNKTACYNKEKKGAQKAELNYKIIGDLNGHYLIEVEPITGRPHQIRVQLSSVGSPIRGDLKYGYPKANEDGNINLHAVSQRFTHPVTKQEIKIQAPLPADPFWQLFADFQTF